MSGQKPRQIAARVLQQRAAGGDFIEKLLEKALDGAGLAPADRGLCLELTYGAVRWQTTLDWLIARKTNSRSQPTKLQTLLRLGLYQIFWLDRIPNHAAVNETVEMAKKNGLGAQAGFVNALLRSYLREFEPVKRLLAELKTSQPHLGFSHPEWLVNRWRERWGAEKTATVMEWNNTAPRTFARLNTLKADSGKLLAQWHDENVECDLVRRDWFEQGTVFEMKSQPALADLSSFRQGLFYVQDPSTLLAVRALDPQPGETILDFCAAPGGKTTCIAQLIRNQGDLLARDSTPDRLKLIEENCARLGVTCVKTVLASSFIPQPSTFSRILVDAPCSNSGVMRRRVDLRWRIRPEEIERLGKAQCLLLQQAASLLKPGGTLVYSTCSLEPEENRQVIEQFLRIEPRFRLEHERELLPFIDSVDGAYVARLRTG